MYTFHTVPVDQIEQFTSTTTRVLRASDEAQGTLTGRRKPCAEDRCPWDPPRERHGLTLDGNYNRCPFNLYEVRMDSGEIVWAHGNHMGTRHGFTGWLFNDTPRGRAS
jgi:hypothetical protein